MLFQESLMVKSSKNFDYIKSLKENTLICVCLPTNKDGKHEGIQYLKEHYPEIYKKHVLQNNNLGDVEVHYIKNGLLLARVYTHTNISEDEDELYMCDIYAFKKVLKYIHEIYSDFIVLFNDNNLDISCTFEGWELIKTELISIYGKTNDNAICKIIIDGGISFNR